MFDFDGMLQQDQDTAGTEMPFQEEFYCILWSSHTNAKG